MKDRKKRRYDIGTLLICNANNQAHLITDLRELPKAVYGTTDVKRREYQLFGRWGQSSSRNKEHRWVADVDLRVKYYIP
jgi:hypothetical protein